MKIQVEIEDELFSKIQDVLEIENTEFNTYLNQALKFYNRQMLKEKLLKSSLLCREESLKVCREFDALPDPIPGLD